MLNWLEKEMFDVCEEILKGKGEGFDFSDVDRIMKGVYMDVSGEKMEKGEEMEYGISREEFVKRVEDLNMDGFMWGRI
jgi:hypothetical protein